MIALNFLISSIIGIYIWVLIGAVIFSWMMAFNLLNVNSLIVQRIHRFLRSMTEPALAQIRRFLPSIGGLDISPVILILLLVFSRNLLADILNG